MESTEPMINIIEEELRAGGEGDDFDRFLRQVGSQPEAARLSLRAWIDLAETWRITQALKESGGNRSAAARALGIGRRTLYAKMDKLGITPTWEVREVGGRG